MKLARALRRFVRRPRGEESGFTLVELLVVIVIEGLIVSALAGAFYVVLGGSSSVDQSLRQSSDARFAATYIASDARNSSGPETSLTDITTCTDASSPVSGTVTPIVRFNWNTPNGSGNATINTVDYVLVSGSVLRRRCISGVLQSDLVLAGNVASVAVTCAPNADCSGTPTSISVTITELPTSTTGTPYTYTLDAAFRKLIGGGAPLTNAPPSSLVVFGGSGCGVTLSGGSIMKIYGDAYINTANSVSCKALNLDNTGSLVAGTTNILAGGTCVAVSGSTCPTVTNYSPAIADPYAYLVAPTTTGRPSQSQSACSGTAQPGVYAATFGISGGATCTLAPGVYILQNGLNLSNGASLLTGAGAGVLIYMTGGALSVSGGGKMTLTATTSGSYSGVAFWQAAVDTSTISFNNNGTLVFNGSIYAPKAQLNLSGGATAPIATAVVVQTIVMTNNTRLSVGASAVALSMSFPASTPPSWTVNRPYPSTTITPAGGDGNYIWSATGLPAGMSINASTGVLSGTPTVAGSASATISLDDQLGDDTATQAFTAVISAAPTITTVSPLPDAEVTDPYLAGISTSGGTTPLIYSMTGNPAGLSMSTTTGAITGTPTASGTFTVVVTVTDTAGSVVTKSLTLVVNVAPTISTASLASGEKTIIYSATVAATGGTTPYIWSATGLPAGLSMSSTTGVISGTPTAVASPATVVVTLTDAAGVAVTKSLSLTITDQPSVVSVTLTNGTGTAGTIEAGDKVTIVYSTVMSVAGFCSTWSNNAADQSLIANSDVTVSIANGTTDSLTVTSAICPSFTIGTINLGSSAYVTAATTFKGTSTGVSKINWTTSTHTLVITLGTKATGTVANVTALTSPIYTAASSIKDAAGAVLGNSPFTVSPAAKRF